MEELDATDVEFESTADEIGEQCISDSSLDIELSEIELESLELEEESRLNEEGITEGLSESDIDSIVESIQEGRSLSADMKDQGLFTARKAGDYQYGETGLGKSAFGVLEICDEPIRDASAQRRAGGDARLPDDDGGHLIGARFGGAPGLENIDAQSRNLNRGAYKAMEDGLAESLKEGDQVFLDVETYKGDGSDRPSAYMGYSITEHPDGSRDADAFSFTNASREEQAEWERISDEMEEIAREAGEETSLSDTTEGGEV